MDKFLPDVCGDESYHSIGFDCAHSLDWSLANTNGIYRDINYVEAELRKLALQLKEIELKNNE